MFTQKPADSQFLNNTTLPRLNETCNGAPKVTSTPLRLDATPKKGKLVLTPVKARQGTPRRYSLSDISPKSLYPSTSSSNVTIKTGHSPGMLLTPMHPKDSISMYEETKSSGLARRIVLYNEEVNQTKNQTHQEKYNSPGLFPVVHLFKEKPPLLQQSPKRVKIKLANSEYTRSFLNQQRSNVLEGINRARQERQRSLPPLSQNDTKTSTKSVLDALKEISRKRIHSNEDYEHEEEVGKRVRTSYLNNGCSFIANKRSRSDSSPPLNSSGTPSPKQSQKKVCVYDEFTASKSSSDFSFLDKNEPVRNLKKKTISTSTESISDPKQIKVVVASTQTLLPPTSERENVPVVKPVESPKEPKEKPVVLKVFDDEPLHKIRHNRLATLLGNLAGKDMSMFKTKTVAEEPLKSILSSPKELNAEKTEKHVHFNVPSPQPSITQVSASIVTPIVSDSVKQSPTLTDPSKKITEIFSVKPSLAQTGLSIAKLPAVTSPSENNVAKKDSAPAFSLGGSPKTSEAPKAAVGFSFGSNVEKSTTGTPVSSSSSGLSVAETAPTFSFGATTEQKTATTSVATTSAAPSFNFLKSAAPTFGTNQGQSPAKPAPAFGTAVTTASAFGSVTTTAAPTFGLSVPSTSTPMFGSSVSSSTAAPTFGLSSATTTSSLSFGGIGGKATTTTASTAAPSFGSGTTATGGFGSGGLSLTTTTVPSFGMSPASPAFGQATPSTTSAMSFGSTSTALPAFGQTATPTTTPAMTFGSSSTATPAFGQAGTASTASSMTFGSGSTAFGPGGTGFGSGSKAPPAFGPVGTATTTSALTFGSGSAAPAFGQATTTPAPTFGSSSGSAFGASAPTTSAPLFGAPSNAPSFGAAAPAFGFGSTPTTTNSLSAPTTTASFGGAFGSAPTTTAPPAFGATSAPPAFGSSNMFGNTPKAPTFGGFSAQPAQFGKTAPPTTTTPPSFGGFGSTPAVTTAAPNFSFGGGSSSQATPNPFGAPTTTAVTASTGFGGTSGNFGGFGSASSTFGAGQSGFNQSEPPKPTFSFGGDNNKSATPSFGSGSAFAKTGAPQAGFGTPSAASGGFGSTTSTPTFKPPQANGGFNFNQTTPSSSFAFGATPGGNAETPKPSFSFTGGASTNPPTFGTPNASFGAAATPQFGAVGTPTFNIGAGSAPSGRRVQRAKRRT